MLADECVIQLGHPQKDKIRVSFPALPTGKWLALYDSRACSLWFRMKPWEGVIWERGLLVETGFLVFLIQNKSFFYC